MSQLEQVIAEAPCIWAGERCDRPGLGMTHPMCAAAALRSERKVLVDGADLAAILDFLDELLVELRRLGLRGTHSKDSGPCYSRLKGALGPPQR